MSAPQIAVGDTVRVTSGQHQGKTGTVVKIIQESASFISYGMALVKFTSLQSDYCKMGDLET